MYVPNPSLSRPSSAGMPCPPLLSCRIVILTALNSFVLLY